MSLISEALRKLSDEDRPPHLGHAVLDERRRPIWPWLVAAGSVSLAVGVIVGVVLLQPDGRIPAETEASPPRVAAPMVSAEPPGAAPSAAVPETVRTSSAPDPMVAEAVPLQRPRREAGAPPTVEEPEVDEVEATIPTQPDRPSGPEAGSVYLESLSLPDGRVINLDGVVWSDDTPVALLNGSVFSIGEGVDDWVVTGIEPRKVEVAWHGIRFFVRVR